MDRGSTDSAIHCSHSAPIVQALHLNLALRFGVPVLNITLLVALHFALVGAQVEGVECVTDDAIHLWAAFLKSLSSTSPMSGIFYLMLRISKKLFDVGSPISNFIVGCLLFQ